MADDEWQVLGDGEVGETLSFALEGEKEDRHKTTERANLLALMQLVIKALIESSMRGGRTLNDAHPQLEQFLVVMEHTLRHRLKVYCMVLSEHLQNSVMEGEMEVRRNMLGQRKSFWGVIESFERSSQEYHESVSSVSGMSGIRTSIGRGRAWIRFVLMQKKLGDHFRTIVESKAILREWYEPEAVMFCEEGMVIAGLLVGLNAIDYNVMMKGEEYDRSVGVLDLNRHLKDGNYVGSPVEPDEDGELSQLLDQKAYLEEHNRKLESSVERLTSRLQTCESENSALRESVMSLEQQLSTIGREKEELRAMNEQSSAELRKALETLQDDQKAELDTYIQSRAGLNDLYTATSKNLTTEQKLRQQLEQELSMQRNIREEKELALQLLEKNTHEKQDTIVSLRRQLEELKAANLKLQSQLKSSKETHSKDSLKVRSLESKLAQITAQSKQLEKEFQEKRTALAESQRTCSDLGGKLQEVQLARSSAEQDLAIEKQWRASLQMEIQREKNRVVELTNETKRFKALQKSNAELQEKYACLQETVSDQEMAMVEMGKQLSLAQQRLAEMKEVRTVMKESVWVDDKDILDCQACQKPFSLSRRKHHCRSCGGVFCYVCSENSMQLASSSKPVRVCDSCYSMHLDQSST